MGHTVGCGKPVQFSHRDLTLAPRVPQRFHGNIQAHFISELEAIGDGFCWIGDPRGDAFDTVFLDSLDERLGPESDDLGGKISGNQRA